MSYSVNGKEYDSWSSKNQSILDSLVNREVYCCMTSEVEYILSKIQENDDDNPFTEEDYCKMYVPYCSECESSYGFEEMTVEDLKEEWFERSDEDYVCPVCGFTHETLIEAIDCCGADTNVYRCQECGKIFNEDEYNNLDTKPEEIFEWWAVSSWFGEKLAEQGCVVIESYGKSFWGRTTTGQAISLDGCIFNIAKNMNILEGMEYEWVCT